MKIPKRFRLMGQTISVEMVEDIRHNDDAMGVSVFRSNEIWLQRSVDGCKRSEEQIGHTFCHELVHWLLYSANAMDSDGNYLHSCEPLVDTLGGLLHQALTTAEYK